MCQSSGRQHVPAGNKKNHLAPIKSGQKAETLVKAFVIVQLQKISNTFLFLSRAEDQASKHESEDPARPFENFPEESSIGSHRKWISPLSVTLYKTFFTFDIEELNE
ncbi:hypothetical protein E2320_013524, partial [Naja naja]